MIWVISSLNLDRIHHKGYEDVLMTKKGRKMENENFKIRTGGIRTHECA